MKKSNVVMILVGLTMLVGLTAVQAGLLRVHHRHRRHLTQQAVQQQMRNSQ